MSSMRSRSSSSEVRSPKSEVCLVRFPFPRSHFDVGGGRLHARRGRARKTTSILRIESRAVVVKHARTLTTHTRNGRARPSIDRSIDRSIDVEVAILGFTTVTLGVVLEAHVDECELENVIHNDRSTIVDRRSTSMDDETANIATTTIDDKEDDRRRSTIDDRRWIA